MIKIMIAGVWACFVTLGAVYFAHIRSDVAADAGPGHEKPAQLIKLKPITVPVVGADGIDGYLLAVLSVNLDPTALKAPESEVEVIIHDAAFRTFYGIEALKYRKPRKSDLDVVSNNLKDSMNKRLGSEAVKNVLLQEFSFVPKEQSRRSKRD
jgi:hypothetical protein